MKAERLYVVVTPQGHVSDCVAFTMDQATQGYVHRWMPTGVTVRPYTLDLLWQEFAAAGYKVHSIDLPAEIDGKSVCKT